MAKGRATFSFHAGREKDQKGKGGKMRFLHHLKKWKEKEGGFALLFREKEGEKVLEYSSTSQEKRYGGEKKR